MFTHLGDLIKFSKQFIEHDDELFGRTVTGQLCEANDVGIQNTVRKKLYILDSLTHTTMTVN